MTDGRRTCCENLHVLNFPQTCPCQWMLCCQHRRLETDLQPVLYRLHPCPCMLCCAARRHEMNVRGQTCSTSCTGRRQIHICCVLPAGIENFEGQSCRVSFWMAILHMWHRLPTCPCRCMLCCQRSRNGSWSKAGPALIPASTAWESASTGCTSPCT